MPPTGRQRGDQRCPPGPGRPPFWVHSPSQGSCSAVLASETPLPRPPSLTHHGEAGVSGTRRSRLLRRRQQLQQLELRRASAPPHSLPAARAAAAARPNGPSTDAARAPPRPAPPRSAHVLPHCESRGSLRAARSANLSVQTLGLPAAARARAPAAGLLSVAARPAPCVRTTSLLGGWARSAARDASLCEPRRYWARAMAEMRARRRLVRPSLQCVKLGRATAWWRVGGV